MIEVIPSTPTHIAELCSCLRQQEADACAQLKELPETAILREVERSIYTYTVIYNGRVAVIFGAIAMPLSSSAYVWVVCADFCDDYPVTFLRESRKIFTLLLKKFDRVYGLVSCDFARSVRWLEWLGCGIIPSQLSGVYIFERSS